MKPFLSKLLCLTGVGIYAYYFFPQLKDLPSKFFRPSFANLEKDFGETPYDTPIMEAFRHFPSGEEQYFFGDFNEIFDIFENHPLVDLNYRRTKSPTARCGYRKWIVTIQPSEQVIYAGKLYVVCRR